MIMFCGPLALPPGPSPAIAEWFPIACPMPEIPLLMSLAALLLGYCRHYARLRGEQKRQLEACRQLETELSRVRDELERRVEERTAELAAANQALMAEIEERARTEETLRASEYRYRELFDSANDMIYVHDLSGNFLSLNKAALQATGYTREEALGMNLRQIVPPDRIEAAQAEIARKLGGESSMPHEMTIVTKDGRRLALEVNSHLVYENGKPVAVQAIARDITERQRLEQQLRHSQKMEAVGRLAGGVAHDFNNHLTVIAAYSQMLADGLEENEHLRAYAQEILWAAERAGNLTTRLLAFSRQQMVEPKVIDLNNLLGALSNMLRRLIGEDVELRSFLDPALGKIKADPPQIEQVVMNLAVNARDAMHNGGQLTLRTANLEIEHGAEPPHPGLQPGSYVVLQVADTGIGMDDELRRHIFEPFFTTKESGKGTGLGLSMVYSIVKQSGGEISVESAPGMGATFTLYFPQVQECADPFASKVAALAGRKPAERETILLVEDEYGVRKLVRKMLLQQGYRVLEAANGRDALQICGVHSGPIHLLITDVIMPGMSGRELAERVALHSPDTRVLYMTGYTDDDILQHGIDGGDAPAMLRKPFLAEHLAASVRRVLDRDHAPA
jgi:two-component system cell cycle sensor histidine kinase/response regulator CckA